MGTEFFCFRKYNFVFFLFIKYNEICKYAVNPQWSSVTVLAICQAGIIASIMITDNYLFMKKEKNYC